MQHITVTSTTDTPETVIAAQGDLAKPVEVKDAPAKDEATEKVEASDAELENETEAKEESGDETKEPKKKGGFQKKIGKLTKQREDARREADYWRSEALKNQATPAEKTLEVKVLADTSKKPAAESFETHEAYVEALADWKVDQKLSQRETTSRQESLKADQEKQLKGYIEKRDDFAKGHDDYFERMEDIGEIQMSLTVNEALLSSDNGPELLYELAKTPEEYKRICSLPALAAARELGKFEAKLSKSSDAKPETKTTKAPKPPTPVGTGSSGSTKKLDELDFEDYKKARMAGRTT